MAKAIHVSCSQRLHDLPPAMASEFDRD